MLHFLFFSTSLCFVEFACKLIYLIKVTNNRNRNTFPSNNATWTHFTMIIFPAMFRTILGQEQPWKCTG